MNAAVLITGASGGIGKELVRTFADAGYAVIATDCTQPPADMTCHAFVCADLQKLAEDQAYTHSIVSNIRTSIGSYQLKALINNAAVQVVKKIEALTVADWQHTLQVNLLAPFFLTQSFLPELEATQGCVLNISSIHARLTKQGFVAYATSKAALSGLTRAMAVELGGRIRVNAIEPAAIDTEMLRAGFEGNRAGFERLGKFHPAQCVGAPEQLARLALSVITADTMFLHGAIIPFDGGIGACLHDPGDR